jgi:hypothetical protein
MLAGIGKPTAISVSTYLFARKDGQNDNREGESGKDLHERPLLGITEIGKLATMPRSLQVPRLSRYPAAAPQHRPALHDLSPSCQGFR